MSHNAPKWLKICQETSYGLATERLLPYGKGSLRDESWPRSPKLQLAGGQA